MNGRYLTAIKEWIKTKPVLYEPLRYVKSKEARVEAKLRRLVNDPQRQVDYMKDHSMLCGYGRIFPRTQNIDLSNPRLFNEKLLWLKYYCYNQDPLVAKCYDKYLVREYLHECGCDQYLNELYGVWDNVDDIPWEKLPEEYIIKKTNGCGHHVFKRKNEPFDVEQAIKVLKQSSRSEYLIRISCGDLFAIKNEQKYICEKLLKAPEGQKEIEDYKFYCFNGKPMFLWFIFNRNYNQEGLVEYEETFKRIDWEDNCNLIDQSDYRFHSTNIDLKMPDCYLEMIDLCQKLAQPFPFVRVDLYCQEGKPVFGELTFTPEGSHMLGHVYKEDGTINMEGLTELGELLDIDDLLETHKEGLSGNE